MSQWPFWIDSSRAAEIARKNAQEEQKKKDQEEIRRKMHGTSQIIKWNTQMVLDAKKK